MAEVTVPVQVLRRKRLPHVCVTTGEPARGFVPHSVPARPLGIGWVLLALPGFGWAALILMLTFRKRVTLYLPMSDAAFRRWHRYQLIRLRAPLATLGFALAGALLLAKGAIYGAPLLLAAVVALGAWFWAHVALPWVVPSVTVHTWGDIDLTGVHPRFVRAVEASGVLDRSRR